jgi:alpha-D-xyloside xylohydrolase
LPLFVRAGSILPLGPEIQYTGEIPGAALELRLYPGADGSFNLYDDEGDSYAYEDNQFAWTPLAWEDSSHTLTVGPREGSYPGMLAGQTFKIVLVSEERGIGVAEDPNPQGEITCQGQNAAQWKA